MANRTSRALRAAVTSILSPLILRCHGWRRTTMRYRGADHSVWRDPETGKVWATDKAIAICGKHMVQQARRAGA